MFNSDESENLLQNNHVENTTHTEGICMEMCPLDEVVLRQKEKLVHILEVTASGHQLVKRYSRSAADANLAVPRLLRPFKVLYKTLQYLIYEVTNRTHVKAPVVYDFLNDRMRAIRQDMTIQALPPEQCVLLLEPMIRFYIYYAYRLCHHPLNDFDPVLNKKYLLDCIKWFLKCSDILYKDGRGDLRSLSDSLDLMDMNTRQQKLICDRILVESLYMLCNLDDMQPLYRYLGLPSSLKRSSELQMVYKVVLANRSGNFVRALKLGNQLWFLSFVALCLHLTTLRRKALQVMSHAYNSQHLIVPMMAVRKWLAFNSPEEVKSTCAFYGLKVVNEKNGICFNTASFKEDVEQPQILKCLHAHCLRLKLFHLMDYI